MKRFLSGLFTGVLLFSIIPSISLADNISRAEQAFKQGLVFHNRADLKKALEFMQDAFSLDPTGNIAYNIGNIFSDMKKYDKSIIWYKKAIRLTPNDKDYYFNLASTYKNGKHDYRNAIKFYKIAIRKGHWGGAYNLALVYEDNIGDVANAIKWYKVGMSKKHYGSIKNLANLYKERNEKVKAGAYLIGLLSLKPQKKTKLLNYLKTKWKLSQTEIKQAYELQKNLVPNPYLGGVN